MMAAADALALTLGVAARGETGDDEGDRQKFMSSDDSSEEFEGEDAVLSELLLSPLTAATRGQADSLSRWAQSRNAKVGTMRGGSLVAELRSEGHRAAAAHDHHHSVEKARQRRQMSARIESRRRELGMFGSPGAQATSSETPFVYLSYRCSGAGSLVPGWPPSTPPVQEVHTFLSNPDAGKAVVDMHAALDAVAAYVLSLSAPPPSESPREGDAPQRRIVERRNTFDAIYGAGSPGQGSESDRASPSEGGYTKLRSELVALRAQLQSVEERAAAAEADAMAAKALATAAEAKSEQMLTMNKQLARRVRAMKATAATHEAELSEAVQEPKQYHRMIVSARRAHSVLVNINRRQAAARATAAATKEAHGVAPAGAMTPATPATPVTPQTPTRSQSLLTSTPALVSGSTVAYATPTPGVPARARTRARSRQRRTLTPAHVRERRARAAALRTAATGATDAAGASNSAAPATAPKARRGNPEWRRKLRDARRHAAPPGTV